MEQIIDHKVISSFKEFLSYKLLKDLSAYRNRTVQLFNYTPVRKISGKSTYGSPYCQWVYDSSITGANIPSGLSGISRGESGLSIDFKNGRVFVNSGTSVDNTINVSVPDFNIYLTTSSIQKIILEQKYDYRPDLTSPDQPVKPDSIIAPCIFISYEDTINNEWALGGVDQTIFSVQVAVFADNLSHLLSVQRVITDTVSKVFPIVPFTPLNELNDLKYGYWNYEMVYEGVDDPNTFVYVEDATFRILDLDYVNQTHPNILVGLGSVKLGKFRQNGVDTLDFPYVYVDSDDTFFNFEDSFFAEVSDE